MITYVWGENAYERFIKVKGVSFDGGKTWIDQYPTTIPSDLKDEQMKIKVSYRLSEDKKWVDRVIDYEPKAGRLFLLNQKIAEENVTISDDMIVNKYQQHPETGSTLNLLRQLGDFLGYGHITSLFPGWTENGELQPWFYEVKSGRHILEPADMVPLDSKYIVSVKFFWMNKDGTIDAYGDQLIYLQTLTDMNDIVTVSWMDQSWLGSNLYDTLSVPKYVQAIAIDQNADLSVNYLEVPDTVMYIKLDDTGMRVNEGYKVDENNERYASNESGILMTKDRKSIIGIPYNTKKLKIEDSVESVAIEQQNQLSEIDFSGKTLDQIPDIAYSRLSNCKIVVPDEVLIPYIQKNYKSVFANKGNTIAASSNPKEEYYVENGMIINKQGRMIMLLESDKKQLNLIDSIHSIAADAFENADDLTTLIMPQNGDTIFFENNSLRNSKIKTIQCYSKEQYDSVVKQLEQLDAAKDMKVQMIATSKEGYRYYMQATEDSNNVVLTSVPKNITQFDGVMTDEEGEKIAITQIGSEVFVQCSNLQWVTLPESVKKIGAGAFKNCNKLEGILIDSKDEITIGDGSLEGCSSLRFVASNAKKGTMENDYQPVISDSHGAANAKNQYLYVPGDCEGYNKSCISLTSGSDTPLTEYQMKDLGNGSKMLYGVDDQENPWLAMRSGKNLPQNVRLPQETKELLSYAMADTTSESGSYQIDLEHVNIIGAGAFYGSDISGDITFCENVRIYDDAMKECKKIKHVTIPGDHIYITDEIFNDCSELETIKIGKMASNSAIKMGMFSGCNNLTDITLESKDAERLMLSDFTFPYQFNMDWTAQQEAEKLKLHIPEGSEEKYIKGWRYLYCGYAEAYGTSAYENMRQQIEYDNMDWTTWEIPTEEEVDAIQKAELLVAENRIRKMIGMSQVTQPTDLYLYHESDGMLTLADSVTTAEKIDLGDTENLELPEGWYLDYVGKGAFKNAGNLAKLTVPASMAGMESNAFEGVQAKSLQVDFEGETPLKLMLKQDGTPYEFGINEDNLKIHVPEGLENEYLRAWIFPMAGYEDVSAMAWDVISELSEGDGFPDMQVVYETMAKRLLPIENRLRNMMGMDEINSIYEICYKDDWELKEPEIESKTSKEEPEKTNQEDTPQNSEDQATKDQESIDQTTEEEKNSTEEKKDTEETTNDSQITIPKTTTKLEADQYADQESDHLELIFENKTPLKLLLKEEGKEFSFGKDDDKITISVPKGCEEAYIEQWKYAMAGYEDLESMKKATKEDLKDEQASDEQINEAVSTSLLRAENRLRKMMKMEEKEN